MNSFEEFGFYCGVVSAMESINADLDGVSSSAMEAETIRKTNKEYDKAGAKIIAKIRTAAKNNDKEACLAAIDELDALLQKWKTELRNMPKDKSETVRDIIKVISMVLAVIFIFKGKAVHDLILKVTGQLLLKSNVAITPSSLVAAKAAGETTAFLVNYASWTAVFRGIFGFLINKSVPENPEYKDDPNAKKAIYRNSLASLDMVISALDGLKNDIKNGTDIKYALTKAGF